MEHYVYILQSLVDKTFYKGYSTRPDLRLKQHNNRESNYTAKKAPWVLVYVEKLGSKREALIRERNLKKATIERILHLMNDPKNIVHQFID